MGFIQNIRNVLEEEYNTSVTENGAVGYSTTGKALLDLNFAVSSLRRASAEEITRKFIKAYYEDSLLAVKWLFFAGDVREGLGERRIFRTIFTYLSESHREIAKELLSLIPQYARWDIVVMLLDTPLSEEAAAFIRKQLQEDRENMNHDRSVSLCAKWLPSENASCAETKRLARILAGKLSLTNREYRRMLSSLRGYLDVVERKMSAGNWSEIDYAAVPSRANLIYKRAFLENDRERRREFLDAVQKGGQAMHAGVLFPQDIVHSYFGQGCGWNRKLIPLDTALEELWKALPDYVQGAGNTLCVADGSGSMCSAVGNSKVSCLDVANALAIYFSERCKGQFQDCYITFSRQPQFVDLSKGKSLHDKIEIALTHNEVANTDIEAVFELILNTAVKNRTPQEEMPSSLLILSDMEFDEATGIRSGGQKAFYGEKLFAVIARRYEKQGYRLPKLVFWNICSRTGTIPVRQNALGVALVSGFSPSIVKMVLSNEIDPYKILKEQLSTARYDAVEEAYRRAAG